MDRVIQCLPWPCLMTILRDRLSFGLFNRERSFESVASDYYLPDDIVNEILIRFPVMSVIRFRLVCRSWCELTSTESFAYANSNYQADTRVYVGQFHILPPKSTVHEINLFFHDERTKKMKGRRMDLDLRYLRFFRGNSYEPYLVSSYKGFLVFRHEFTQLRALIFYNPLTLEQVTVIAPPCQYIDCGFFFHLPTKEFRVLYQVLEDDVAIGFAVLSLRTRSLRQIKNFSHHPYTVRPPIILNGALHWNVCDGHHNKAYGVLPSCSETILSFGMESEEFRVMPHPGGECESGGKHHPVFLLEMDGRLGATGRPAHGTLAIWIIEDYSKWVWVKKHIVKLTELWGLRRSFPCDDNARVGFVVSYIDKGELLMKCRSHTKRYTRYFFYNLYNRTWRLLNENYSIDVVPSSEVVIHTDSLVSLQRHGCLLGLTDNKIEEYDYKRKSWSIRFPNTGSHSCSLAE